MAKTEPTDLPPPPDPEPISAEEAEEMARNAPPAPPGEVFIDPETGNEHQAPSTEPLTPVESDTILEIHRAAGIDDVESAERIHKGARVVRDPESGILFVSMHYGYAADGTFSSWQPADPYFDSPRPLHEETTIVPSGATEDVDDGTDEASLKEAALAAAMAISEEVTTPTPGRIVNYVIANVQDELDALGAAYHAPGDVVAAMVTRGHSATTVSVVIFGVAGTLHKTSIDTLGREPILGEDYSADDFGRWFWPPRV